MRAHTYTRRGESGHFWFCPVCRNHVSWERHTGVYVQVGNEMQAIVCEGACAAKARTLLAESFPGAFPDVDDRGVLLE